MTSSEKNIKTIPPSDRLMPLEISDITTANTIPNPPRVISVIATEMAQAAPTSFAGGTPDWVNADFKLAPQRLQ